MSACTCSISKGFYNINGGYCQYCRIQDHVGLINRLKQQFSTHPFSVFITLTYDDICIPVFSNGLATLWKDDLSLFVKRFRRRLEYIGIYIKVFAVGEYGGILFEPEKGEFNLDGSRRRDIHPHYHLMIFSQHDQFEKFVRIMAEKSWNLGHCHILQTSSNLMSYITGYVTKKLTNDRSMEKVMNLKIYPEFRLPTSVGDITEKLMEIQELHGEVRQIRLDGKTVNIDKYNKRKLKEKYLRFGLDMKTEQGKEEYALRKAQAKAESLQKLYEKVEEQEAEILSLNMFGDIYKRKSDLKKQKVANFKMQQELKKQTKGIKIL